MPLLDGDISIRRALPLTPLIDVVFLLLLFFMLASTFTKEGEIELSAGGSNAAGPGKTVPYLVRLHAGGHFDIDGRKPEEPADLGTTVQSMLETAKDRTGVVVQLRRGTFTKDAVSALTSLKKARITPVTLVRQAD